ncbi:MAG: DEAD/DEAH box helicase [Planctomycetes bacterium]|nr:DEAD/DEAH box helicase [Planctomycetota bacterium]
MSFENLKLSETILRAIQAAGYTQPTPIQAQAIPLVLEGRDVLGCAQTGTGKTAAFAFPIIHRLTHMPPAHDSVLGPRALVLCPTRELAQQIHDAFLEYGKGSRLLDLVQQGHAGLSAVEILVLDEADRMLDMGFLPDIRRILSKLPKKRQNLLFSATMPPAMEHLAHEILHNPIRVEASRQSSPAETVEHWVHFVESWDKPKRLAELLTETPHTRALVFTRTKRGADRLAHQLDRLGVKAAALHGDMVQKDRTRVLESFRSGDTPVVVATDIAARGLDIDDISHVYNYELSHEPETYVHRIGRAGRAGATGTAVTLCSIEERATLQSVERLIGQPLRRADLPQGEDPAAPGAAPGAASARPALRRRGRRRGSPGIRSRW